MSVDTAVVTGGAGGLGRIITRRLAERNLVVIIADTDDAAALELVAELARRGLRAVFLPADLREATAVERQMADVANLGRLRVLINNAGGWLPVPQYPKAAQWRQSIDLNLVAPMLTAQLVLPLMRTSGGSIVDVASSGGLGSKPYGSPEYGAAKAGLIRFTSCVADGVDQYQGLSAIFS